MLGSVQGTWCQLECKVCGGRDRQRMGPLARADHSGACTQVLPLSLYLNGHREWGQAGGGGEEICCSF